MRIGKVRDILENEWYAVRYSGEIPEVALHSALYYLTADRQGPGLILREAERRLLVEAAVERFRDIILRDLLPANRSTPAYRGIKRTIVNYHRYLTFCTRQGLDHSRFRGEIGEALRVFLLAEIEESGHGRRGSCINCSFGELSGFAAELGLERSAALAAVQPLCP